MAPEVLHRVLFSTTTPTSTQARSLKIYPALLNHYTRHRVIGCDYPAIIPDAVTPNACVRGTYVEGLTDSHIWRLDIFEGDQYERVKIRCRLLEDAMDESRSSGELVEAETYVWEDKEMGRNGLEEGEWDFDEFRQEKMRRWVGDQEYAGELRRSIRGVFVFCDFG